jgi:exopolysaccharide biosynthesis WecB/TagA/CpsF family protein
MGELTASWSQAQSKLDLNFSIEKYLAAESPNDKPQILGFLNAYAFNCLVDVPGFYQSVIDMDVILRDGIGVAILLKLQGKRIGRNMNGTDLIPKILDQYIGKKVAVLGTREPYLGEAVRAISKRHDVDIRIVDNGFESEHHYLSLLEDVRVDLILLAMGMPKQEKVAVHLKNNLQYPTLIVCGGAIIDFYAQRIKRAPLWVQRIGCEWLHRLFQEPTRLFSRYVTGNIIFLSRALIYTLLRRKSVLRP